MNDMHATPRIGHETDDAAWLQPDVPWARAHHAELLAREAPDALHDDAALIAFFSTRARDLGLVPNRLFDEAWYLANNQDVAGGVQDGIFATGFQHYYESGFRSRAPHWLYSEEEYFSRNPDLTPHGLDAQGFRNGYDHFLRVGDREGRSAHPFFDPLVFRADALASHSGIDLDRSLFAQYLSAHQSARTSWYFDPSWYLDTYPQVRDSIAWGEFSGPLHHYLTNTSPQDFDPNPLFSEAAYAAQYPDVHAIVQNGGFRNAFEHFRRFGVHEGREPGNAPDFAAYRARPDVVRDLRFKRAPDAFAHLVAAIALHGADAPRASALPHGPVPAAALRALAYRRAESLLPLVARAPLDFQCFGPPALSVVITARNGFLWTIAALAALRESTRRAIQPILVDDGSTDGTRTIERLAKGLTVIRPERRTALGDRLALGLHRVQAPVVLFLDPALQLRLGAVDAALAHFDRSDVSIVTGRVTALDQTVIEAGLTVYRDGNLERTGAGGAVDAPEISFVRDCDAGSAGALFVRTARAQQIERLALATRSLSHLLVDLSLSVRQGGGRVVYDPAVLARSVDARLAGPTPEAVRLHRRDRFRTLLRNQPAGAPFMSARAGAGVTRVLVLCDRVPLPETGGRFATLAARIALLSRAGYGVTVYPLDSERPDPARLARVYGEEIEILHGAGTGGLAALFDGRRQGFDRIWIAGTRVLDACLFVFHQAAFTLPTHGFVLDIAGLSSVEQRGRRRLGNVHDHDALMADLRAELRDAWFCQTIVVGSEHEAGLIRQAGYDNVQVLAHGPQERQDGGPVPGFAQRHNVLCAPSIQTSGDAAHDGIDWFVHAVVPRLDRLLPPDTIIEIAGYHPDPIDLSPLARYRRIRLVSADMPLDALCRAHRVLVVPDRFSAGVPPELLAAADAGLPAVISDDIAGRLDWADGQDCMTGGVSDPTRFAEAIARLYGDETLWTSISTTARATARDRFGASRAISALQAVLNPADAPASRHNGAPALIPSEGLS